MDFASFRRLWREHGLVHLAVEVPADLLTPASVFLRLKGDKAKASFLFESVEAGENVGRYSIIGVDPVETVILTPDSCEHRIKGRRVHMPREQFTSLLRSRVPLKSKTPGETSSGLQGGWVGYFGYDCIHLYERLPMAAKDVTGHPWAMLGLYEEVVLFDHVRQNARAVVTVRQDESSRVVRYRYDDVSRRLEKLVRSLEKPSSSPELGVAHGRKVTSNMTRPEFARGVRTIKRHIAEGDIFQGVFSQRFNVNGTVVPFDVYRRLRRSNPSPYMYFLKFGDLAIAGSSPETLVQKRGSTVMTRPIAGTRPRGGDREQDRKHAHQLLASPKENAEHVMLVDLGRNDLGRVSRSGTVETTQFRTIERYSHVMHMVSTVTGQVRPKTDAFDVLAAAFPAGTVTGAPKIRAMEIIDEIEPDRRGVYAGCVGYVDWCGDLDVAITIRTAVMDKRGGSVQAGAGIVADSDPDREYLETCDKAAAPLSALGGDIKELRR